MEEQQGSGRSPSSESLQREDGGENCCHCHHCHLWSGREDNRETLSCSPSPPPPHQSLTSFPPSERLSGKKRHSAPSTPYPLRHKLAPQPPHQEFSLFSSPPTKRSRGRRRGSSPCSPSPQPPPQREHRSYISSRASLKNSSKRIHDSSP